MTNQFVDVEDRLISGKGIIQIPSDPKWRYFRLFVDVIRKPRINFFNFKWQKERSEFAKMQWMRGRYVFKEGVVNYISQTWDVDPLEASAFHATPIACSFQAVFDGQSAILAALGVPPGGKLEIPYEPVSIEVDRIIFECRDETLLQLRLQGLETDVACPEGKPTPKKPSQPPPPLPELPPNENVEVSPPYNGDTSDDGETEPFTMDEIPDEPEEQFPIGGQCEVLRIDYRIFVGGEEANGSPTQGVIFGPLDGVFGRPTTRPGGSGADLVFIGRESASTPLGCADEASEITGAENIGDVEDGVQFNISAINGEAVSIVINV